MRLPSLLSRSFMIILAATSLAVTAETKYPSTATLSYELVSSPSKPSHLATINYDPKSLRYTLVSWTPPPADDLPSSSSQTSTPLIRILSPSGSSTVTTLSTFSTKLTQHINLYISSASSDSVLSASVTSTAPTPLTQEEADYLAKVERAKARGKPIPPPPKPSKKPTKKPKKGDNRPVIPEQPHEVLPEGQPKVNLVPELEGPRPKLLSRAPPAVDEQGNEVETQEVQEKTFLQKYWWVMLAGVVLMMGAGGGEGK